MGRKRHVERQRTQQHKPTKKQVERFASWIQGLQTDLNHGVVVTPDLARKFGRTVSAGPGSLPRK